MSAEGDQDRQSRRSEIYWRSKAEKDEVVLLSTARGYNSLNSYILFLVRQDQRAHGGGRLASLDRIHAAAVENRLGISEENEELE